MPTCHFLEWSCSQLEFTQNKIQEYSFYTIIYCSTFSTAYPQREGKACLILLSYIPIIASHNNLLSFPNLSKIIFSLCKIDYIQLTILALYHSHHGNPFWIQRFYTFVHDLDPAFNKTKNRQRLVPKSYPWIHTRSILAHLTVTRGTVCWKKNREKKRL